MTVNKAQGKTILNAGIYLPESVFSHGQLYVQLSISTARKNVNILVIPDAQKKEKNSAESKKKRRPVNTYTKNMVWKEIFTS